MKKVYEGWDILFAHPRRLTYSALLLCANILLATLSLMIASAIFGHAVGFVPALLIAALSSFSILLAITPGNVGILEGVIAFGFSLFDYGFGHGLAVAVLCRAVSMINVFLVGPPMTYLLLRKRRWTENAAAV